jgi:hypothetical protein
MRASARRPQRLAEEEIEPASADADAAAPAPTDDNDLDDLDAPELGALEPDPESQPHSAEPDPISDAVAASALRQRQRHLWDEIKLSIALVPFVFAAWPFSHGWIGWVVFVNGVACHMASGLGLERARALALWDIAWNVALCLYVNILTHWQPGTLLVTTLVLLAWLANGGAQAIKSVALHVVGVQWMLCALLFVYEYGRA